MGMPEWLLSWAWPVWRPELPSLHPMNGGEFECGVDPKGLSQKEVTVEILDMRTLNSGKLPQSYSEIAKIPFIQTLLRLQVCAMFDSPLWQHVCRCEIAKAGPTELQAYWKHVYRMREAWTMMWQLPHRQAKVFIAKVDGKLVGTATLGGGEHNPKTMDWINYFRLSMMEIYTLSHLRQQIATGKVVDANDAECMKTIGKRSDEVYYVSNVAVAQGLRGMGVGSKIMKAVIEEAERDGKPLVLDTDKEINIKFYERHGFKLLKANLFPSKEVGQIPMTMWRMVRLE